MTLYVNESEMLERLVDSLKKASARALEFPKTEMKKRPELFVDFIDAIKVAAGSSHQLAHAQMNPKFLDTRDILEGIITVSQTLPLHSEKDDYLWTRISESLDQMVVTGRKMATSKAMTRLDVLQNLDHRAQNLSKIDG